MKEFKISKEELKKIMETPGGIKGTSFKGEMEYVLEKEGEEGLKAVEKETKKLGYPIEYEKIKETEWYPVGLKVVSLYAALTAFNWGKEELAEMGEESPKVSFIIRLFMRHFASPEKIFRMAAPRMWKRHFDVGSLEAGDFKRTKKDGYAIFRVKNFKLHPLHCFFFSYYLVGAFKLTDPRFKEITVDETKCVFRGDPYHEYLIKWTYK